jgi:hypothetical protein
MRDYKKLQDQFNEILANLDLEKAIDEIRTEYAKEESEKIMDEAQ